MNFHPEPGQVDGLLIVVDVSADVEGRVDVEVEVCQLA